MSSGKKGIRSGGLKQAPDPGQGISSRPASLPPGYYDYYGIPRPKEQVQAKRFLYPGVSSLPRGYLEYYGIITPEPSTKAEPELAVQTKSDRPGATSEAEHIHDVAVDGTSGPSGTLPFLGEIQKSFGTHDVSQSSPIPVRREADAQAAETEGDADGGDKAAAVEPAIAGGASERRSRKDLARQQSQDDKSPVALRGAPASETEKTVAESASPVMDKGTGSPTGASPAAPSRLRGPKPNRNSGAAGDASGAAAGKGLQPVSANAAGRSGGGTGAGPGGASVSLAANGGPGELLATLDGAPASQMGRRFSAVEEATPHAFVEARKNAVAALPEMPAPTGLPSKERASDKTTPDPSAPVQGAQRVLAQTNDRATLHQESKIPEVPPAPALTPTQLAGARATPAATQGQTQPRDPALERSAQNAIQQVRLPSERVPASADAVPEVDLGGEADPGQIAASERVASTETETARRQAVGDVAAERGEQDISPAPDAELLRAQLDQGTPPVPAKANGGKSAAPELPAEALASIDAQASPILAERIGAEQAKYAAAQAEFEAGSEQAHAQAASRTSQLETEARTEQQTARAGAQAEVAGARADWQGEIDGVQTQFRADAARAEAEHGAQIRTHQETGNREAARHMQKAETAAAIERRQAEAEAETKKNQAKEESGGFWGWVKSAAEALVDGLKQAVNFIYDNLRKAVKAIFEAAKKLALAAIDLARRAVVGLIKAFGEVLKGLVTVALAAFPKIRERMLKRIDDAVNRATARVNQVAAGLKKAVAAVLDFLASTIDSLLKLVQDIYNGILTVVGMLVSGELAEIMAKLGNLVAAAQTAPGQFETAAYEELLGGNLDETLSPAELLAAGRTPPRAFPAEAETLGGEEMTTSSETGGEEELAPRAPWTEDNVGVEHVASGLELSPELSKELMSRAGEGGEIAFGESDDNTRSIENILGLAPTGQSEQDFAQETAQSQPQTQQGPAAADGLSPRERAQIKWTLMKQGLAKWWSDNWPYVIGGGILAVAGFIVANILTGGAILAALPPLMTAIGYLFTGIMVLQLAGHLRDFLQKGWAGSDPKGAGKSLAKGLAAGAIEVISWLTFKVGSVAMKGAKAAGRGIVRGAQAAGRAGARMVRGAARLARRGVNYVLKGGKVLLRGVGDAIERGVKRLGELAERLLQRTRFKGFRIRLAGRRFILEGKINPWVLLASGQIVEVSEGAQFGDDVVKVLTPNQAAQGMAEGLGFGQRIAPNRAPFNSHGQQVFGNGKKYITRDIGSGSGGSHRGGVWKMFDRQGRRIGTYNADLTVRIGD